MYKFNLFLPIYDTQWHNEEYGFCPSPAILDGFFLHLHLDQFVVTCLKIATEQIDVSGASWCI